MKCRLCQLTKHTIPQSAISVELVSQNSTFLSSRRFPAWTRRFIFLFILFFISRFIYSILSSIGFQFQPGIHADVLPLPGAGSLSLSVIFSGEPSASVSASSVSEVELFSAG
jgi:hypothetical protein